MYTSNDTSFSPSPLEPLSIEPRVVIEEREEERNSSQRQRHSPIGASPSGREQLLLPRQQQSHIPSAVYPASVTRSTVPVDLPNVPISNTPNAPLPDPTSPTKHVKWLFQNQEKLR